MFPQKISSYLGTTPSAIFGAVSHLGHEEPSPYAPRKTAFRTATERKLQRELADGTPIGQVMGNPVAQPKLEPAPKIVTQKPTIKNDLTKNVTIEHVKPSRGQSVPPVSSGIKGISIPAHAGSKSQHLASGGNQTF